MTTRTENLIQNEAEIQLETLSCFQTLSPVEKKWNKSCKVMRKNEKQLWEFDTYID